MLGKTSKETDKGRAPAPRQQSPGTTSVISKDMRIEGNCTTQGSIRVLGTVSGNVTAGGLEVASTGRVEGDVIAADAANGKSLFVIDGRVDGAVRAPTVEVRANAKVTQGIEADDAVVHGYVAGGIIARRRLALEDTASVEGDVRARRLSLKEGGKVNGTLRMGDDAMDDLAKASGTGAEGASKASGKGIAGASKAPASGESDDAPSSRAKDEAEGSEPGAASGPDAKKGSDGTKAARSA